MLERNRRHSGWILMATVMACLTEGGRSDGAATAPAAKEAAGRTMRTDAEVRSLIQEAGKTPPAWWDSVPLEYPKTLDLSWPEPTGPWDESKNVGQYIWSTINPNPRRWASGVRFLHYLLTLHKDDRAQLAKITQALGCAYFNYFEDWARSAFWLEKSAERAPLDFHGMTQLADCYWKLGSSSMARAQLAKTYDYWTLGAVKLLSDMGDIDEALEHARGLARAGLAADGYLAAGDACRLHGRAAEAISYYEKVLAVPAEGDRKEGIEKAKARARASVEAVKVFDALELKRIPDGRYRASSIAYEAPLDVEVAIRGGRIESVQVTRHQEKQFYSSIAATPRLIVEKQGVRGVDAVTGATITSEAIINAAAKALAAAMK